MARHRTYIKSENGFTLIETIVALAIMAMIIVAFFIAMSTSGKALLIAQERTTAESIARSVMESVKQMEYYSEDGSYTYVSEEDTSEYLIQHPQFSIWSVSVWDENGNTFVEGVIAVNWDVGNNSPAATDNGLQRIEVLIKNGDREVYTLEDYKVDR